MAVTCFTQEFATPDRSIEDVQGTDSRFPQPHSQNHQGIKNIDFVEGEGGVGSIKQINFAEGGHLKHLKHRIDALDAENLICKYTLIEADVVFDKIESVAYEVKFEASCNGGCVCKMASEYRTKASAELKEQDIKQGKDKAMGLYKVVEEYLQANPSVYA